MLRAGLGDISGEKVVKRHHCATDDPCTKQLVLAVIETQWQDRERDVIGFHPEIMRHADRAQPHIRMAQHHALGLAGRAAGIEDRRQFVGITRRRAEIATARFGLVPAFLLVQKPTGGRRVARLQRTEPRTGSDQHLGAAIGEDVGDLGALQQRIDRDVNQSCACCGKREQAGRLALRRPARHASTLGKLGREPGGQQSYTRS